MHAIPATWEAETGGLHFEVRPGKKLVRVYPKEQNGYGCTTLQFQLGGRHG
jgi:hypothetical protein